MLYKQICVVSLTGLLTTRTFGGNYYFTANSGDTSCGTATANDTCNFNCNVAERKQHFDCGQSGQCNIDCTEQKCFESATISASNVVNLNVYSSGIESECYKSATFNLPNHGNATFSITGIGNNPFKQMTVNAGTNTNQIIIDCDDDDNKDSCKQMQVNAQNAQYLEINIGDANLNGDYKSEPDDPAIINCPQNSNYNGPNSAPCYIKGMANFEGGNSLDLVTINTLYGIPMDLWIDGNDMLYKAVTVTGANIPCTDEITSDFTQSSCWYTTTAAPTTSSPTTSLPTTSLPTTSLPTTSFPTTSSSTTSVSTTAAPKTTQLLTFDTATTAQPTLSSETPLESTYSSTIKPTLSTIFSSTISSILLPVMSVAETISGTKHFKVEPESSDKLDSSIQFTVIIFSLIGIILCLCCIIFIMFARRHRSIDMVDIHMENTKAVVADANQKNEMHEKQEIYMDVINVPPLCMVPTNTQSVSLDMAMVNTLGLNTADGLKYGEMGTGATPIELEIEGNIANKLNFKKINNPSMDDVEIIFEDDEIVGGDEHKTQWMDEVDMEVLDSVNDIKQTPMGPMENNMQVIYSSNNIKQTPMGPIENNIQCEDDEIIKIALDNFSTKM